MRSSIVKTLKKYGHSTFELTEASQPDAKKNEWKQVSLTGLNMVYNLEDAINSMTNVSAVLIILDSNVIKLLLYFRNARSCVYDLRFQIINNQIILSAEKI